MPFPYYQRLSRRNQAIYRASDEYGSVELDDPAALRPIAEALSIALDTGDARVTRRLAQQLLDALFDQLNVPRVLVRVLAVRPSDASGELHGLYERDDDDRARITVWMRTAARGQVVRFKTFLRTLLHEACHHLDYDLLDLADSFHTEGFFQRESSLVRVLTATATPPEAEVQATSQAASPVEQLALFRTD